MTTLNRLLVAILSPLASLALSASAAAAAVQDESAFGTASPAYAAVRWLWFLTIITTIGAVGFRLLIVPNARGVSAGTRREAVARAARVGLASAAFAVAAAGLRLMAQSIALLGGIGPDVVVLITGTTWGAAWLIHLAAASAALAAFALAVREVPGAWALATISIPALAAAPALAGHATTVETLQPIPIIADAVHVLAAGGWVGGLLVLLTAGLPAARQSTTPWRQTAAFVAAFSPLAMSCAAIILATGAFAAINQLDSLADLFGSDWGRLLVLKLVMVIVLAAFGAWNFLRLRPQLDDAAGEDRLRRSATSELAAGAAVLLVTAFLVATEPPAHDSDVMAGTAGQYHAAPDRHP